MIGDINNNNDSLKGISPIIGVILLVAVTVVLVALLTVIAFDITNTIPETADATIYESDGSILLVTEGNTDSVVVRDSVGDTKLSVGQSYTPIGSYSVIGIVDDSETVIYTGEGYLITIESMDFFGSGNAEVETDEDEIIVKPLYSPSSSTYDIDTMRYETILWNTDKRLLSSINDNDGDTSGDLFGVYYLEADLIYLDNSFDGDEKELQSYFGVSELKKT